jgi:hypothetical protein
MNELMTTHMNDKTATFLMTTTGSNGMVRELTNCNKQRRIDSLVDFDWLFGFFFESSQSLASEKHLIERVESPSLGTSALSTGWVLARGVKHAVIYIHEYSYDF